MEQMSIFQLVESLTNTCNYSAYNQFLLEMKKVHPTLQQKFAGFILSWIKDYAENYPVDDRNKCSIEECQKLLASFHALHDNEEIRTTFPLV